LSVVLSQIDGPVLGGIAAAFPAVFTSTLIILNRSRGTEFSRAMTKPLVLCGILTIIPFSVAVRYLYPILGIWFGTLFSYVLIIPLAILSYYAGQHQ
jgi:glycopeptide antibiotics resistance protein